MGHIEKVLKAMENDILRWLSAFFSTVGVVMKQLFGLVPILFGVLPPCCSAGIVLDESGVFGPTGSSERREFAFDFDDASHLAVLTTDFKLTQGKMALRIAGPDGKNYLEFSAKSLTASQPINTPISGRYVLELVPTDAVGTWSVRIKTESTALSEDDIRRLASVAGSGAGMILVGMTAALFWRLWTNIEWRWFWVGAAVWAIGVALKFAWAIPLNTPILATLGASLSHNMFLTWGSIYIGLLTGVFEIGVTLLAALYMKNLARNSERAVAIGIGAGAIEAILLGLLALMGVLAAVITTGVSRQQALTTISTQTLATPMLWLLGPSERLITLLCHTASRTLVLFGVAKGKWAWPFLGGFSMMTLIDAIAGYVYLAGIVGKQNLWLVELIVAPAALVSIPIIVQCVQRWPKTIGDPVAAEMPTESG